MPNSDTRITDTYFDNAITAYPCGSICFAGSHCLATKGGTPSLYIYLTQLFTAKCQTVKKLVGRGTIVPVLHLCVRHSLRFLIAIFPARIFSRSRSSLKNSAYYFVEFETLCTFVSANILKSISDTVLYFIAKSCSAVSVSIQYVCQNTEGLRFFCVHTLTNFCSEQWQTWTKVASPRTTVTGLHLCVRRSLRFLIAIFPARIFSKQCSLRNRRPMSSTSTAKPSTASRCPYRGHTMRVTRSWRWVVPSSSSATGISALLSTTSAYAKGLSKIINGRPWRRVPPPRCGHLIEL